MRREAGRQQLAHDGMRPFDAVETSDIAGWRTRRATAGRCRRHHRASADELAARMGEVLKWDGRWDYEWGAWIDISREFVDTTVIPALGPGQQRIIADSGPDLREEIRSQANGRIYRSSQLAWSFRRCVRRLREHCDTGRYCDYLLDNFPGKHAPPTAADSECSECPNSACECRCPSAVPGGGRHSTHRGCGTVGVRWRCPGASGSGKPQRETCALAIGVFATGSRWYGEQNPTS